MALAEDDAVDDVGPDDRSIASLPTKARDYLVAAADNKGHSQRLYCRVAPMVGRLIQQVYETRRYPFRTQGDLIRWCVVDNCKRLAAGPGVDSVWRRAEVMLAQLAEEEYQLQFLDFFQKTQEVVDRYIVDGSPGEARRVVASMKGQIDAMPDTELYWKERYQKELLRRWKMLLDGVEGDHGSWDTEPEHHEAETA